MLLAFRAGFLHQECKKNLVKAQTEFQNRPWKLLAEMSGTKTGDTVDRDAKNERPFTMLLS